MKGWLIGLGIVAILGGGAAVVIKTRGIRNNNPGNLERNGTPWLGLSDQQTDSRFFQFIDPKYGIRALARTLITYYEKHNITTVRGIINRWAPPNENDTASYIAAVCKAVKVGPDERINVRDRLIDLTAAIIKHENGVNPYSMATIQTGVQMA